MKKGYESKKGKEIGLEQRKNIMSSNNSNYTECAAYLNRNIREDLLNPEVMIICGSGLSGLSKNLTQSQTFNYEDIPGFPRATVPGHHGELVFGYLGGLKCMCMRGRFHFYEGNSMEKVVFPVRVGKCLGVKLLLVTNAAGGLNPDHNVGDIIIIQDHIGFPTLTGQHPCTGINDSTIGPRFFPTSDAYDPALQEIVINAITSTPSLYSLKKHIRPDGTYCFVSGPSYESKAEARFLRMLGGDVVGMSSIPEVLAARHCGMKILGLSLVTNKVLMDDKPKKQTNLENSVEDKHSMGNESKVVHATHEEVLGAVQDSGRRVESVVKAVVQEDRLRSILNSVPTFTLPPSATLTNSKKGINPVVQSAARTTSVLIPAMLFLCAYVMNQKATV